MRSLAVVVPKSDGERTRRMLSELGLLRTDLEVVATDEELRLPVHRLPERLPERGRGEEHDFASAARGRPKRFRDLLALSPSEMELLPRAFDVVGDVVVVRLPDELRGRAGEIGDALLRFVPAARVVAWDHGVHGTERRRSLERIAGEGAFRTEHRENGIGLVVDLSLAYFSPRLAREHARVAGAVRSGETVFDLCCGIGPFSLTIAHGGRSGPITAVDVNPDAIALLDENLRRLGLEGRIRPVCASVDAFLPSAGVSDRAILNLPREGIKYVAQVAGSVARGGTLHYYEVTERSEADDRGPAILAQVPDGRDWRVAESHVVHPYSPQADVIAYTLVHASS